MARSKLTEKASEKWKSDFKASLDPFLLKGDYKGGFPLAKAGLKKYPHEFVTRFNYAKLLGDWADEVSPARKKKMKSEAIRILRPLTRSLAGMAPLDRFGVSLNYYYQSESWTSMYAFGRRFARFHRQKALYAQGLGATLQAFSEFERGRSASAYAWSKRAMDSWERYDFKHEKYYFPHYCYAKALAVCAAASGERLSRGKRDVLMKNAITRLRVAARLGKRPVSDWEFSDVMTLVST